LIHYVTVICQTQLLLFDLSIYLFWISLKIKVSHQNRGAFLTYLPQARVGTYVGASWATDTKSMSATTSPKKFDYLIARSLPWTAWYWRSKNNPIILALDASRIEKCNFFNLGFFIHQDNISDVKFSKILTALLNLTLWK
jgi:hypothetical protein